MRALEADAHRLKRKAEDGDDVRAALVAVDKLLEIVRLLHELTPRPKPSPADVQRVLEWMAAELDVSVDELAAECERLAQIQGEILAGRTPPHTERPAPVAPAPALPASSAAPAPVTPAPGPAPPSAPFRMSV